MPDLMREQLWAYLDGELHGTSLQAMQVHLETCTACQEELIALRQLSQSLRQAPLPASLPTAARFAEELVERLPPQPASQASIPMTRAAWLVPMGMLIALVLIQATSVLSMLVRLAEGTGLLGEIGDWLSIGSSQTLWFGIAQAALQNMLNLKALLGLQVANDAIVGLQQWFINPLLWQSALALAYLACLTAWWFSHQSPQAPNQVLE
jgi:predicted anti-sigma-YlaC factor YlaD